MLHMLQWMFQLEFLRDIFYDYCSHGGVLVRHIEKVTGKVLSETRRLLRLRHAMEEELHANTDALVLAEAMAV